MKEEMVGVKLTLSTDNTNGNVSTAQARIDNYKLCSPE